MYHCFRLTKGMDLKKEIEDYVIKNKITGVILSSVGCLSKLAIRLADGKTVVEDEQPYEIVSVMGTLSKDGVHLHISASDGEGKTIGGHLKNGCIVNTTAEIVLLEIKEVEFSREFDETTGYEELVIR